MSHPRFEPARQQRVDRAAVSRAALFSHPPRAEVFEQRRPPVGRADGRDGRATPFSGGAAEQRRPPLVHAED